MHSAAGMQPSTFFGQRSMHHTANAERNSASI